MPYYNLPIDDFAALVVNTLKLNHPDFHLNESNKTTVPIDKISFINAFPFILTSQLNPAHELVFTSGGLETKVIYTEVNGALAYCVSYYSPISQYATYLPEAQKVINSFGLNNNNINMVQVCQFIKANPAILTSLDGIGQTGSYVHLAGSIATALC